MSSSIFISAADDTRLHVRLSLATQERAPTCLLLHGFGEGSYVWRDTEDDLKGEFNTVSVDLRGHGDSEPSRSGRYDLSTHLEDVALVVRTLGIAELSVMGHSLGAQIAVHLPAKLANVAVRSMTLVDVCLAPSVQGMAQATRNLAASLRRYERIDEYKDWLMNVRPLLSEQKARELAVAALRDRDGGYELRVDPKIMKESRALTGTDTQVRRAMAGALRAFQGPILLVRGMASAYVSVAAAKEMMSHARLGRIVTVPRAGHAVMSDNPDGFASAVREFVASHERHAAEMQVD